MGQIRTHSLLNCARCVALLLIACGNFLAADLGDLLAIANNPSNERHEWAYYELKDNFGHEPKVIALFVKTAGISDRSFIARKVSIQGLAQNAVESKQAMMVLEWVALQSLKETTDGSLNDLLAREALESLATMGPSAYSTTDTLTTIIQRKKWVPIRVASLDTLRAIGTAAQAALPTVEPLCINETEPDSCRSSALEAAAALGSTSVHVFDILCKDILARPTARSDVLTSLGNSFAIMARRMGSNTLTALKPWEIRRLDEVVTKVGMFFEAHAKALPNLDMDAVHSAVARFHDERARQPCSDLIYFASRLHFKNPLAVVTATGVAGSGVTIAVVVIGAAAYRRRRSRGQMSKQQLATLKDALVRLQLWDSKNALPTPHQFATGVAGRSQVYMLFLPNDTQSGLSIVAKFDEPSRAAREWKSINELFRLNTPSSAILPIRGNREEDGVIIYCDVTNGRTEPIQFKQLIVRQLLHNIGNCLIALEKTLDELSEFYRGEPGAVSPAHNGEIEHWRDEFSNFTPLQQIKEIVETHWSSGTWAAQNWRPDGTDTPESLPNPFYKTSGKSVIETRLDQVIMSVMRSRVHGDLNLTNILMGLDAADCPTAIFIIDLAHSEAGKVTAADLARLESEFWQVPFVDLHNQDSADAVLSMTALRDSLEGRKRHLQSLSILDKHVLRFIWKLRQRAITILQGNQPNYRLKDYFLCLCFQHLAAISRQSVRDNEARVKIAVLGASLSLKVVKDIEDGRYGEGAACGWAPLDRSFDEMLSKPQ